MEINPFSIRAFNSDCKGIPALLEKSKSFVNKEKQEKKMNVDPKIASFLRVLNKLDGPPLYKMSPAGARKFLDAIQEYYAKNLPPIRGIAIQDLEISTRAGSVPIRIVRPNFPQPSRPALPFVIVFHGGGWVMGGKLSHDRFIRTLALDTGMPVVLIDYTRAPEARFPVQLIQVLDVTRYLLEHGNKLDLDPSRVALVGDSVGGNMALVISMIFGFHHQSPFKALGLLYPVTDASMNSKSYQEFQDGPWLTKKAMAWFYSLYLPEDKSQKFLLNPLISPLRASSKLLRTLPPTLLITDENDVLRDEGEWIGRRLRNLGIPTISVRYNGLIHDFAILNALEGVPSVIQAKRQVADFIVQHLKK